jgi:hypothetical protein
MPRTNTLAYHSIIDKEEGSIAITLRVNVIKLFNFVTDEDMK